MCYNNYNFARNLVTREVVLIEWIQFAKRSFSLDHEILRVYAADSFAALREE